MQRQNHRRKTLWVDPSLAWMLAQTRIDICGSLLKLPFPCCAFVFTDPGTLELCASLIQDEDCGRLRDRAVEILTVYAVHDDGLPDGFMAIHLYFMLDAGRGEGWPFLISRDLAFDPEDDLEAILDSRYPDVVPDKLGTLFLSSELKMLEQLVINAILYTTSAHLGSLRLD